MDIKKLLGKKIKKLRQKKGLTQEELADMIGISQRTLSGIEIGENFLSADTLNRLMDVLGIVPDDIFAVEHLKSTDDLVTDIISDVKSVRNNPAKVENIYKVVKALVKE